jgi:predicted Zn-dependent protease
LAKRHAEAVAVLQKHAANRPNDEQLWYDLAELAGLAGNITLVHEARAEYFICVGEFARAKDHLNFALQQEADRLTVARLRSRLEYIRDIENTFYR